MTYHIAVCDDSGADRQLLGHLVNEWAEARGHTVQTETFSSAESFLFRWAERQSFDLLLLDVEMGEMDGVELARRVRRDSELVQIVFITGYSDYIAEGYEVEALHYLLKPVRRDKLFQVLDRAADRLRRNSRCLNLSCSGELVRIPCYRIRYLDVQRNYVTVHADRDYTVKRSLSDFSDELGEDFVRVGRGLILNLSYVRRVTKTEVHLAGGEVLPLPRGAYEPLNRAIIDRG
ncbi:MAG: LytTR family DNA-binding domain-containing protein [Clostridiales bacterium]|nr:LytTR family DNA-binding domain-containing protein [Clostridiales bacterium]